MILYLKNIDKFDFSGGGMKFVRDKIYASNCLFIFALLYLDFLGEKGRRWPKPIQS